MPLKTAGNMKAYKEEEEEEHVENEMSQTSLNVTTTSNGPPTFAMSFRDIEDSIRSFSGDGLYHIEKWVSDFEELSQLLGWGELHSFIFAKKSLSGIAKLFIQSETGINSWFKLKNALLKEFSSKLNSAQLHAMLSKRKMEKEETVQEYFLIMKELATRGDIEDDALFQYVTDGIQDDSYNKMVLYGATNVEEFKKKLKIYEEMKKQSGLVKQKPYQKEETKQNEETTNKRMTRCFSCGTVGHKAADCRSRGKGSKCFKCNQFGHKSFECTEAKRSQPALEGPPANVNVIMENSNKMHKEVVINGFMVNMLIDTGSQVNVIRRDVYESIGSPELQKSNLVLNGFGKAQINPVGCFKGRVMVDDDNFYSTIHVANEAMTQQGIIGCELLNQAEVLINQEGLRIKRSKIKEDVLLIESEAYEEDQVTTRMDVSRIKEDMPRIQSEVYEEDKVNVGTDISAIEEDILLIEPEVYEEDRINTEIDVSKVEKSETREKISSYQPEKTCNPNFKEKIVVEDDEPIANNPRCLPYIERRVEDEQVEEWLKERIVGPIVNESKDFQKFEEKDQYAFEQKMLSSEPVLTIYKEDREMELQTDASQEGYGAILFQKDPKDHSIHPVYNVRKKATDGERKYRNYELEVLKDKPYEDYLLENEIVCKSSEENELLFIPESELMIGVEMKCPEDRKIEEVIEEDMIANFDEDRAELRRKAKVQITKVQGENRKTYKKRWTAADDDSSSGADEMQERPSCRVRNPDRQMTVDSERETERQ